MSVFEAIMLICFGLAWPFSIVKGWKTKNNGSKSIIFLYIVLAGYIAGIMHKSFYSMDKIIWLYSLNGFMVFVDIMIYYRNKLIALKLAGAK